MLHAQLHMQVNRSCTYTCICKSIVVAAAIELSCIYIVRHTCTCNVIVHLQRYIVHMQRYRAYASFIDAPAMFINAPATQACTCNASVHMQHPLMHMQHRQRCTCKTRPARPRGRDLGGGTCVCVSRSDTPQKKNSKINLHKSL